MATARADINSDDSFGTSLEQFRSALTSDVARRNMGLQLDDERARAIAADSALSAACYKLWRSSVSNSSQTERPTDDGGSDRFLAASRDESPRQQEVVARSNNTFDRNRISPPIVLPGHADELISDWQRQLPVRFNRPPGWPQPSKDWILQHIGLEMSDDWRPPGAPADDPPGWMWWIPQEPAWTTWINSHNGAGRMLRPAGTVFGVFVGLTLTLSLAGWTLWLVLAGICAFISGVGLLLTVTSDRHFRRDPLGELRDYHLQVAVRLKIGAPVGDGHHIGMADFSDFGGWFDGE